MKELDQSIEIEQRVLDAVKSACVDGKLACAKAERLAEELGVSRLVIGQAATKLEIKLKQCQLGCF